MMNADNIIRLDVAYDDLQHNFNYRDYLQKHEWADFPHAPANPLSREWGKPVGNRVSLRDDNFMEKALRLYWKDLVLSIRSYAREKHGREILITSNGVYPYVDFNSLGLYNHNFDDDGQEADYMPITATSHLDGARSLMPIFRKMLNRHHDTAGKVPLIAFLDFPTDTVNLYYALPTAEKKDFWQIYLPEAYACGLYYAFHLRTCIPSEPTAEQSGVLDFMIEYSAFYRKNQNLYQNVESAGKYIKISTRKVAYSIMDQPSKNRWLIHLINHSYSGKAFPQSNFTVSFIARHDPSSVFCVSPDFTEMRQIAFSRSGNLITLAVESLTYYDVLVVNW